MSKNKKFSKILAITAVAGTAVAAAVAYFHKNGTSKLAKQGSADDFEDEGFLDDDFDFPEPEDTPNGNREYFSINSTPSETDDEADKPAATADDEADKAETASEDEAKEELDEKINEDLN